MDENQEVVIKQSLIDECHRITRHMVIHRTGNPKEYDDYFELCKEIVNKFDKNKVDNYKIRLSRFTLVANQYNDVVGANAAPKRTRDADAATAATSTRKEPTTQLPKWRELEVFKTSVQSGDSWNIPRIACVAGLDVPHDLTHARTDAQKGDTEESMRDALLHYFDNMHFYGHRQSFTKINEVISHLTKCSDMNSRLTSMSNFERKSFDFLVAEKYKDKFPLGKLRSVTVSYEDLLHMDDAACASLSRKYEHLKFYCPDDQDLSKYVGREHGASIGLKLIKLFFDPYTENNIRFIVDGPHGGAFIKFLRWISQVRNTVTIQGFVDSSTTSSSMLPKATEYYHPVDPVFNVSPLHTPLIAVNDITIRLECDSTRFNSKDTTGIKVILEKIQAGEIIQELIYDFTNKPWKQGPSVTDVMAACVSAFTEDGSTHEPPSCHMDMLDFEVLERGVEKKYKPKEKKVLFNTYVNHGAAAALKGAGDPIQGEVTANIQKDTSCLTIFGTVDILCAALSFLEYDLPTVLLVGNSIELFKPRVAPQLNRPLTQNEIDKQAAKQAIQQKADKLFTDSMLYKPSLELLNVKELHNTLFDAINSLKLQISQRPSIVHIPESKQHIIKAGTIELECLKAVRKLCGMELSIIHDKAEKVLSILRDNANLDTLFKPILGKPDTSSLLSRLTRFNTDYDTDPFQPFDSEVLETLSSFLKSIEKSGLIELNGALQKLFNPKVLKTTETFIALVSKTASANFPFWDCTGKNLEILEFDTSLYDSLLKSLISFKKATVISRSAAGFKKKLIDSITSNNYLKEYKMLVTRFGNLGIDTNLLKVFEVPLNLTGDYFDAWINAALMFVPPNQLAPEGARAAVGVDNISSKIFRGGKGDTYNKNGRKKRIIMNGGAPSQLQNIETNMLYHRMSYEIYKLIRNVICDDIGREHFDSDLSVVVIVAKIKQFAANTPLKTLLYERLSIIFADFVNDLLKIQMSSDYQYDTTAVDCYTAQIMDAVLSKLLSVEVNDVYSVLLLTPPTPCDGLQGIMRTNPLELISSGILTLASIITPYLGDRTEGRNKKLLQWSAVDHRTLSAPQDIDLTPNDPIEMITFILEFIVQNATRQLIIDKKSFKNFGMLYLEFYRETRNYDDIFKTLKDIYIQLTRNQWFLTPEIRISIEQILAPIVGGTIRQISSGMNRGVKPDNGENSSSDSDQESVWSSAAISQSDDSSQEPPQTVFNPGIDDNTIPNILDIIISDFNRIFATADITHMYKVILKQVHDTISYGGGASSRTKNKITKRNCRNVIRYKKSNPVSKSVKKHKYNTTTNRSAKKTRKNRNHRIRRQSYEKSGKSKQRRSRKINNH